MAYDAAKSALASESAPAPQLRSHGTHIIRRFISFILPRTNCDRRDWKIIKRVFVHADGEFWTAGLPPRATKRSEALVAEGGGGVGSEGRVVSLAEARAAFQKGGFSVVINRLQRRWRGVAEVALALEDVLGHPVNANLYMTPPGSQGFEAHFDWMDGGYHTVGTIRWVPYGGYCINSSCIRYST